MTDIFARRRRMLSLGLVVSVSVIAFESLAVATILPTAAIELDGFGSSGWAFTALMLGSLVGAVEAGGPSRFRAATRGRAGVGAPNGLNQPTSAYASVAVAANPASVTCGFHLFSATCNSEFVSARLTLPKWPTISRHDASKLVS